MCFHQVIYSYVIISVKISCPQNCVFFSPSSRNPKTSPLTQSIVITIPTARNQGFLWKFVFFIFWSVLRFNWYQQSSNGMLSSGDIQIYTPSRSKMDWKNSSENEKYSFSQKFLISGCRDSVSRGKLWGSLSSEKNTQFCGHYSLMATEMIQILSESRKFLIFSKNQKKML